MTLLAVDGLTVTFPTADGTVHAVTDVSLELAAGEITAIVGESGCGKSVTALAVMGLLPQAARVSGRVCFDGVDLLTLPAPIRARYRGAAIGMVFQDPMSSLNPVVTIGWQLAEAVRLHDDVSRKTAAYRAIELLELVGIPQPAMRAKAYPHEFSGGMRQRVMIAMAIANDPHLLIADEPTTALDVTVQAQILEMLLEIRSALGVAMLVITHDLGVVAGIADRVAVMYAGRIVEVAPVHDLFAEPRMPYTAGLLAAIPSAATDGGRLTQIPGTPPSLLTPRPGCPFAPRCPLVIDRCRTQRPELAATDRPAHAAACHRWPDLSPGRTTTAWATRP